MRQKINPLAYTCPQCKSPPGVKCQNFRSKPCGPHRERGKPVKVASSLRQGELFK